MGAGYADRAACTGEASLLFEHPHVVCACVLCMCVCVRFVCVCVMLARHLLIILYKHSYIAHSRTIHSSITHAHTHTHTHSHTQTNVRTYTHSHTNKRAHSHINNMCAQVPFLCPEDDASVALVLPQLLHAAVSSHASPMHKQQHQRLGLQQRQPTVFDFDAVAAFLTDFQASATERCGIVDVCVSVCMCVNVCVCLCVCV